jgi:hypothetical protein
MRVHFVLNNGGAPTSKLADVEIHFEGEGILKNLKLTGTSIWRSKKGDAPTVLVPSRSYATAGGVRYFELLRASSDEKDPESPAGKEAIRQFKSYIRDEYQKIAGLQPIEEEPKLEKVAGRKKI